MRILFVSGIGGDTRRYRCLHHQEQLARHGIASTLHERDDLELYVEITICDVLVLHRVPWSPLIADIVDLARARGIPVVFETDDLVFAPEVFDRIAYLDTLPPAEAHRFRVDLAGQVETFAHSDCVLTTTGYLAAAAVARGKPAYIHRNACSAALVAAGEHAFTLRQQRGAEQPPALSAGGMVGTRSALQPPFVLGYFSGTGSHNRDFATITPVLAELMARYPHLWLHIGGHLEAGPALLPFAGRIRRSPFVAWQELPTLVAQIDVNLAPLELDNPFCQAKSEIKFTEAALVGVPTVASPTEAFAYAITDGEDGLLAQDPDAWRTALTHLIEHPDAAARLGAAARRKVYAAYLPEQAAPALVATLSTIVAAHGRSAAMTPESARASAASPRAPADAPPLAPADAPFPVPGGYPAVLHLLAERMLRRLTGQAAEIAQLQRQADQLRSTLAAWDGANGGEGANFWRTSLAAAETHQQAVLREIIARLERSGASSLPAAPRAPRNG
jgi:glycosyltransferase involved in cell wall biosynthesis